VEIFGVVEKGWREEKIIFGSGSLNHVSGISFYYILYKIISLIISASE